MIYVIRNKDELDAFFSTKTVYMKAMANIGDGIAIHNRPDTLIFPLLAGSVEELADLLAKVDIRLFEGVGESFGTPLKNS